MSQLSEEPQPGDLVEFTYNGKQHWAFCEGKVYVIHLVPKCDITLTKFMCNLLRQYKTGEIKRDRLGDVVRNNQYKVNNTPNDKWSSNLPWSQCTIFETVKKIVEMEVEYHSLSRKSKCIADYLRYVNEKIYTFEVPGKVTVRVGIADRRRQFTKMVCETPQPGDLIEIFHKGYQHWAIFEGDGYVIHLAPPPPDDFFEDENTFVSAALGLAVVKRQLLNDVVGDCPYRINNYLDVWHSPKPQENILSDAKKVVNKRMDYSLLYWNCEHFATCLRNKIAFSAQAEYFLRRLQYKNADEISERVGPVSEQVLRHSLTTYGTYNACDGIY